MAKNRLKRSLRVVPTKGLRVKAEKIVDGYEALYKASIELPEVRRLERAVSRFKRAIQFCQKKYNDAETLMERFTRSNGPGGREGIRQELSMLYSAYKNGKHGWELLRVEEYPELKEAFTNFLVSGFAKELLEVENLWASQILDPSLAGVRLRCCEKYGHSTTSRLHVTTYYYAVKKVKRQKEQSL